MASSQKITSPIFEEGQSSHTATSVPLSENDEVARWTLPGTNFGVVEIGILLFALSLFAVGAILGQLGEQPDAYPNLTQSCVDHVKGAIECASLISKMHEQTHTFAYFNFMEATKESFQAIAIAIAVTVGVARLLETRSRDRLNSALAARAQKIAVNVFDGLFGNNHSIDLLEKLKRDILYKPVVRESLNVLYELSTYNGKNRLIGQRFTKVKVKVSSTFKNIASSEGSIARQPLELSMPNPLLNELKRLTTLDRVVIKRANKADELLSATGLATANRSLQDNLKVDAAPEGIAPFGLLELAPGEVGGFEIEYTMMKEAEDSEFLRSYHTTSLLHLTIIDSTKRNLLVRAKAIHAGSLKQLAGADSVSQWELKEIVLPHQGVMIWWKEPPSAPNSSREKKPGLTKIA